MSCCVRAPRSHAIEDTEVRGGARDACAHVHVWPVSTSVPVVGHITRSDWLIEAIHG